MRGKGQRQEPESAATTVDPVPLITALTHELSQPLAAIASNSQAVRRFLDRSRPDLGEARAALREILTDCERARLMVEQMRAALAMRRPRLGAVSLNEVLGDVVPLVAGRASSHGISLRLELAPVLPPVAADRAQLQQVVHHLLANALDTMIQSHREDTKVIARTSQQDHNRVELTIVGAEEPERLAFWREVIAAHRGRLWHDRTLDGISMIRFTLPVWRGDRP